MSGHWFSHSVPVNLLASLAAPLSEADWSLPWPAVAGILSVLIPAVGWIASRYLRFVNEVATLRSELQTTRAKLETEHAVLVERISHLPTSEQFAELNATMREHVASTKNYSHAMGAFQRRLDLFQDYLERRTP